MTSRRAKNLERMSRKIYSGVQNDLWTPTQAGFFPSRLSRSSWFCMIGGSLIFEGIFVHRNKSLRTLWALTTMPGVPSSSLPPFPLENSLVWYSIPLPIFSITLPPECCPSAAYSVPTLRDSPVLIQALLYFDRFCFQLSEHKCLPQIISNMAKVPNNRTVAQHCKAICLTAFFIRDGEELYHNNERSLGRHSPYHHQAVASRRNFNTESDAQARAAPASYHWTNRISMKFGVSLQDPDIIDGLIDCSCLHDCLKEFNLTSRTASLGIYWFENWNLGGQGDFSIPLPHTVPAVSRVRYPCLLRLKHLLVANSKTFSWIRLTPSSSSCSAPKIDKLASRRRYGRHSGLHEYAAHPAHVLQSLLNTLLNNCSVSP